MIRLEDQEKEQQEEQEQVDLKEEVFWNVLCHIWNFVLQSWFLCCIVVVRRFQGHNRISVFQIVFFW